MSLAALAIRGNLAELHLARGPSTVPTISLFTGVASAAVSSRTYEHAQPLTAASKPSIVDCD